MKKDKENVTIHKEYFTVLIEASAPIILTYKVLAETPELAAEIAIKLRGQSQTSPPKISFSKLSKLKAKVYKSGTTLIQFIKNF